MNGNINRCLAIIFSLLILSETNFTYAASFEWAQTDWSGGISTLSARHPENQTGWNTFLYKDPALDISVSGQIYLPPLPSMWTDTEFNGGITDNATVIGTGADAYLKLRDYSLSFGTGEDSELLIDGKNASGGSDGFVHPRPVSTPSGITLSTGASGNLSRGTYYYRVTAFNSAGESAPIRASYYLDTTNRSIILSWDPVPCADGYRIYGRGVNSSDRRYGPLTTLPATQTSWEDNNSGLTGISASIAIGGGAIPPGSYFYKITAYNDNGETVIALTDVSLSYTSSITIGWRAVSWAKGYRVYGRPPSENGVFGFLTATTTTAWTDTGAITPDRSRWPEENNVSDGSYLIDTVKNYSRVSVVNCGGISATAAKPMSPPQNVTASIVSGIDGPDGTFNYVVTAVDPYGFETRRSSAVGVSVSGTNAIQISWGAVTGAAGYRVYRTPSGSFSTSSLVYMTADPLETSWVDTVISPSYGGPHINTSSIPTPSATISRTGGAMSPDLYYYVLTAVDTSGSETTPGAQREVNVYETTGTSSVTLSWGTVPEAAGYRIYRTTYTIGSGLYKSPSLICKIDNPAVRTCKDTLSAPMSGAPPRSYDNAITYGKLEFKVNGEILVDSSSAIYMDGKGSPGGAGLITAGVGKAGAGPGAGGDRGAGGSYGTAGSNNSSGTGNIGYPYGDSLLTRLYPGSGGASGSRDIYESISGRGGAAGGDIRIFAETINITGEISANGAKGRDGVGPYADGGGGGSGGTLLLGGRSVSIGTVSAMGGMGGSYGNARENRYTRGGSGGDGRIRIASDNQISATISPLPYTGNRGTFESRSFELDTGGVTFSAIRWTASFTMNSTVKFQIATNKDNATWNFVGPDGTSSSYYTISGAAINPSHNGNRYLKYRVYIESLTTNPLDSPVVYDVSIDYLYTPRYQKLESSPYDSTDPANSINRARWSERITAGSDVVLQIRTSADGTAWGPWLGPHSTTFSSPAGVKTITVASASGFTVGSRVTLTNSTNASQVETREIVAISANSVTLDSNTTYTYSSGSIFTDTYTDPSGSEPINSVHRDGVNDRWFQYRVYLFSDNAGDVPYLLEDIVSYGNITAVYQPDGSIESIGNSIYTKSTDPGVQVGFNIIVRNDGNPESINDFFEITWNTPVDISGGWDVMLNDGVKDFTSDMMPYLTDIISVGGTRNYTVKVTPSPNAPPASKDVIIDIHSGSDYAKVDSIKASVNVNIFYKADGIIDGNGDNSYDANRIGAGGASTGQADPGETTPYFITLQNEGNVSDTYTLSLLAPPPTGWKVFVNDGSNDYDITDPAKGWTTPVIPPPPDINATQSYTLKVIPVGDPITKNIILDIYSNSGAIYLDSLTATVEVSAKRKVDAIINGYGDGIYGGLSSGAGGFTSKDIPAGTSDNVVVGIQNEGNVADTYLISWNTPAGWAPGSVVLVDTLLDGSTMTCTSPCEVPAIFLGEWPKYSNPAKYNPGEVPPFTFKVTPPSTFTTGSETIIFDIQSVGDSTKADSVKAVINSGDTTPPASAVLSTGSITATSVKVSWTAPGDDGTSGTAASYDLRYSTSPMTTDAEFVQASRVRGCKTGESNLGKPKAAGGSESCTASQLFADTDYYFALKTSDEAGNISPVSICPGCPARTLASSDAVAPGAISDLMVTDATKDTVTVCWTATADDDGDAKSGSATGYELRYSTRYIVEDGITPGVGQVAFSNAEPVAPKEESLRELVGDGVGNDDGVCDKSESCYFSPPPKSPGMRECYIIPVENKIDMVKEIKDKTTLNITDDRTRNTRFYFAIKALDEARNKSPLSNIAGSLTPLIPYAYNMVSVPYVPSPNTPADVFGDDVGGQLYVYRWNSMGPENDQGCYDGEPGPYSGKPSQYACLKLTSIKEGLGYLLWVPPGNGALDVPSGSAVAPTRNCQDNAGEAFTCYVLPLQDGWNMIGPSFDREINFTSMDVGGSIERGLFVRRTSASGVEVATFQDAVTARNWIDGSVYTSNGVNYTYEVCERDKTGEPLGTGCSLVMQPWKAYWIRMHVIGGAAFELLIPN